MRIEGYLLILRNKNFGILRLFKVYFKGFQENSKEKTRNHN